MAYLEPLTADMGALRVVPGSHRLDERVLSPVLHGPAFRAEETWHLAIREGPSHVIETVPGDVIVFDEHLWHATAGGRHRHQWLAEFVLRASTAIRWAAAMGGATGAARRAGRRQCRTVQDA